MLSFFRRFTKSRYGLIVVFLFLGLIALAFGLSDVTGMRQGTSASSGTLATVGSRSITDADVRAQIDLVNRGMRQRGQAFNMQQFLAQGGYESVLQDMISTAATVEFARRNGMTVSDRLVDSTIAEIPAFQGIDGKFSQKAFDQFLGEQRFTAQRVRADLADAIYQNWLVKPFAQPGAVPDQIVATYASIELARRYGTAAVVPTIIDTAHDPDEKTLTAYYNANKGRFMVPQRRVIRYAMLRSDDVKAQSTATEAEIADAYRKAGPRYAAKQKRTVRQLILADQATANQVAGEIKGGKPLADAAKTRGLEPAVFDAVEKADLARQTSTQVADAAFAASQGGVAGPIRTPLGWALLQVDKIENIAAKSLDQARAELAGEITARKTLTTLVNMRQQVEDSIGDGATFDEAVAKAKLTVARIGPVAADGKNPDDPAVVTDPALAPVLKAGFSSEPGDEAQLASLGTDGSFAVVAPERVIPRAPRPLAQVRKELIESYRLDEGMKRAQVKANEIVKKINAGTPIEKAFAEAGVVPPKGFTKFDYVMGDVGKKGEPSSEVVASMQVPAKKAAAFASKARSGYLVVYTAGVEEHDARGNAELMQKWRQSFGQLLAREQLEQFGEAVRKDVKVVRNEAAIARLKADLGRGAAQ